MGPVGRAALAVAAVAFGGCGGGGATSSSSSASAPPPPKTNEATPRKAPHSSGPAYAGLGATTGAFRRSHSTTPTSTPGPGVATYRIDSTRSGRVTAYSVQINATPRVDSARMGLVEGINLPDDVTFVRDKRTCQVFKSKKLAKLVGGAYAQVTTVSGSDMAQIALVPHPTC